MYELSATLQGHTSDVRGLAYDPATDALFSCSRDGTVRRWVRQGDRFAVSHVFSGHSGFVNSLAVHVNAEGESVLLAGGQDTTITAYSLSGLGSPGGVVHTADSPASAPALTADPLSIEPSYTLVSHAANVCALAASPTHVLSGSWDATAKVWSATYTLEATLTGHTQSVWAVLPLPDGSVLTGSADASIRRWVAGAPKQTFAGHTQAVRALALLSDDVFASASNDATIRLWSVADGALLATLHGHDSFVYALTALPGRLVSTGEDRSVRVWALSADSRNAKLEQTLYVPAVSVWAAVALPNGDVAVGASDGVVRIFTAEEARRAAPDVREAHARAVAETALTAASTVGDVKKSDLPGPEALATPGTREGDVKMIKDPATSAVEAYQWTQDAWQKIGQVVDAVGSSRKQLHDGREYDYVFDVDVQDGVPPLKLPYNASENPHAAAQRFLQANELPISYIDQVVDFIEKNTRGVQLGGGAEEYVDPYTGTSRYTGGGASGGASGTGGFPVGDAYVDPYTGSARYTGSNPTAGAHTAAAATPAPARTVTKTLFPLKKIIAFDQAKTAPLKSKLIEINGKIGSDSRLSLDDLQTLSNLADGKETAALTADSVSSLLLQLLTWPPANVFPALDLIRIIANKSSKFITSDLVEYLIAYVSEPDNLGSTPKEIEINARLTLRALANLFGSGPGLNLVLEHTRTLLQTVDALVLDKRLALPTCQNALATITLNFSVLAASDALEKLTASLLVDIVGKLLTVATDSEGVYRTIVAWGNLTSVKFVDSVSPVEIEKVEALLEGLKKTYGSEARIVNVIEQLG